MGQFKPMVKMMTTEPSVELKLKKGGHAKMPKMKAKGGEVEGHKSMMNGGVMGKLATTPALIGRPAINALVKTPGKPSMSERRRAMGAKMKEGGESKSMHAAEMKKMAKTAADLKEHAGKPASKAHKGLKKGGLAACATGGVPMGQGGYKKGGMACATGGVAMGQGGYKKGGKVKMAKGGVAGDGIINTESQGGEYRNTKMVTAHPDMAKGKTGEVKKGAGGYKKGGQPKKYQAGGVTEVERQIVRKAPAVEVRGTTSDREEEIMRGFRRPRRSDLAVPAMEGVRKLPEMMPSMRPGVMTDRDRAMQEEILGPGQMSMEERRMLQEMMKRDMNRPAYKKGGSTKKAGGSCYAKGGSVNDSGKAEKMPQGSKKPAPTIEVSSLSGTFKKGGLAQTATEKRLNKMFQKENAPAMKAAKKMTNEKYGRK